MSNTNVNVLDLSIGDIYDVIADVAMGTGDEAMQEIVETLSPEVFTPLALVSAAACAFTYAYESPSTDILRKLLRVMIEADGPVKIKDMTLTF